MRVKDPDFVTGKKGAYKVQPPIVHPERCVCAKCQARTPEEAATGPLVTRYRRASPHPDSRVQSASYAREMKRAEEEKLREAMRTERPAGPISLANLCQLYFDANPRNVSPATLERDRINARNLSRIIPASLSPEEIDEPAAVMYRNDRRAEGAAPRTIQNELSFLRMILNFGFTWQRRTGIRAVRLVRVPDVGDWEETAVALTIDEFATLLEAANERDRSLLVVGVTTMLRRRPLLGLRGEWLDVERKWLSVPKEWQKKGKAKRRYPLEVPISSWTVSGLVGRPREGLVWPSGMTGEPLTTPHRILMALSARTGVRAFSCHDLRTTGASWLREAGVDELVIALLLGHRSTFDAGSETFHAKSSNVTRTYTKIFESTLREATAVFDDIKRKIDRKQSGLRLA